MLSSNQFKHQNNHTQTSKGTRMEIHSDLMPAANATRFKNILRILPYLAVMGMIWGYLAAALSGLVLGLLLASVTSVVISIAGKL
jgi:hypothetical protein